MYPLYKIIVIFCTLSFVFSQYIYVSLDVYPHTGHTTDFKHHSAPERVTKSRIRLPSLLFRWRTAILLSYTSEYDNRSSSTSSRIYSLRYQLDISHKSWVCFVGHQRVSIYQYCACTLRHLSLVYTVKEKRQKVKETK